MEAFFTIMLYLVMVIAALAGLFGLVAILSRANDMEGQ